MCCTSHAGAAVVPEAGVSSRVSQLMNMRSKGVRALAGLVYLVRMFSVCPVEAGHVGEWVGLDVDDGRLAVLVAVDGVVELHSTEGLPNVS